ncbi:MAG: succinate dehydrogenase, cytochrome b556 subunit [Chloroflexi bacterium]|nr:succinate dehydrogenase, cytochrome b556 subunit [Chloroflexota bacterium]
MNSLVLTLTEALRYRGGIGQWSWILHRVSGLGVVLFLTLHVIDTSWAVFYPGLYEEAIAAYQSPLFTLGEFALVACVVYHAYNGIRIVIFDFQPRWWKHQQRAAFAVLGADRRHVGAGVRPDADRSDRPLRPQPVRARP